MRGAEENLRRSIPQSNNLMRVALERDGEGAAEAQISDLENPLLLVQKQVLGLEIAVEDAVAVAVRDALAELEEKALNKLGSKGPSIRALAVGVYELLEVSVEVLEYEVEDGLGEGVGGGLVGFGNLVHVFDGEEAHDVDGLGEKLQKRDLSERRRRHALLVHLQTRLLQRHHVAASFLACLVHFPIGSFSHLLQLLVLLHFRYSLHFDHAFHQTDNIQNMQIELIEMRESEDKPESVVVEDDDEKRGAERD